MTTVMTAMPAGPEISFRLPVAVREDKEATCFVSYCAPLDLYSAGRSQDEALIAIGSAIQLFIKNCFHRKVLDDFLVGRGFRAVPSDGDTSGDGESWFIAFQRFGGEQRGVDVSFPLSMAGAVRAMGTLACPL